MIYPVLAVIPVKLEQGLDKQGRLGERSDHSAVCVFHINEIAEAIHQDTVTAAALSGCARCSEAQLLSQKRTNLK